jgi:hypothetical protein
MNGTAIPGYNGPPAGYDWARNFLLDTVPLPAMADAGVPLGPETEPEEHKELARHPALARIPEDQRFLAAVVASPFGDLVFTRANSSDEADKKKTIEAGLAAYDAGVKIHSELLARADKQKGEVQPFQPYLEQPKDIIPILRDAYQNPHLKETIDKTAPKLAVEQAEIAGQQKDMIKGIKEKIGMAKVIQKTQRQAIEHAFAELEIQDTKHQLEEYKEKLEAEEKESEAQWEFFEGGVETIIGAAGENPAEVIPGIIKMIHGIKQSWDAGKKDSKLQELQDKAAKLEFKAVVTDIANAVDTMKELETIIDDMQTSLEESHSKYDELIGKAEDWFNQNCSGAKSGCDFDFKALSAAIKSATETANRARKFSDDLQESGSIGGPVSRMVSLLRDTNETEMRTVGTDMAGWFGLTDDLQETEDHLIRLKQTADTALAHAPGV